MMHLEAVEIFQVALPLRRPMATPCGRQETLETVLVALHSQGMVGWGEASPGNAPLRHAEWAAGAFAMLRDFLAPAVVGQNLAASGDLAQRLAIFGGNPFAKAALDGAWWDLNARLHRQPLHQFLGGKRDSVEVGPTFDRMASIDDLIVSIAQAVDAGFSRVKLKLRPGWDINMVDFVRKEFATLALVVDCEAGLNLSQTDLLHRLEDFSLDMIEQPLAADDLVGHAMVQESLRTPICLDESIATPAQAAMALELHSGQCVNLKPGRVGGLTPAAAICDLCHDACVPCLVGAMPQSAIAGRIAFALAAKENCTLPADYFPSDRILAEDIAEPLLPVQDPADGRQRVHLGGQAGIGVEPHRTLLEKFCVRRARC